MSSIQRNILENFFLKFGIYFFLLYYITKLIIGLSVKGGYYIEFVHNNLDYISLLRKYLLIGSKTVCELFNFKTFIEGRYVLKNDNGFGVRLVYSCLGYGIISFWIAFVMANRGSIKKKIGWMFLGVLIVYCLNVLRISLLLISITESYKLPFGINHHSFFNIIVYIFIICLVFLYDKNFHLFNQKKSNSNRNENIL